MAVNPLVKNFLESTIYQSIRIEEINANLIYYGLSTSTEPATSDRKWMILREIQVGGERIIHYAGTVNKALSTDVHNDFDKVWDDRAGYNYGGIFAGTEDAVESEYPTLAGGGLITEVTVNEFTWTKVNSLAGRQAIAFQNRSGAQMKFNFLDLGAPYVGVVLDDADERSEDTAIDYYFKSAPGSGSVVLIVEELK